MILLGMELLYLDRGVLFDAGRRRNLRVKNGHGVGLAGGGGMRRQVLESAINNKADDHDGEGESDAGEYNRPNIGVAPLMANRRTLLQMFFHARSLKCHRLSRSSLESRIAQRQ